MAETIEQLLAGEKIMSIEQFGHRPEPAFYVRTEQHPSGGWVWETGRPPVMAAAAAVWAALQAGAKPTAFLYYTTWHPDVPAFRGVTRIFLQ